jgi:hypothetical protein
MINIYSLIVLLLIIIIILNFIFYIKLNNCNKDLFDNQVIQQGQTPPELTEQQKKFQLQL